MKRKVLYFNSVLLCLSSVVFSQEPVACTGEPYEIVLPFMGQWKEYTITEEEVYVGDLISEAESDGCSISQRFASADGNFSYRSFGYVEASSGQWKEVYVFNNGRISEYIWFREGTDVIMRRTGGTRKLEYEHQLRLTNLTPGSYDVIEEHSHDKGESWIEIELTRIKKVSE